MRATTATTGTTGTTGTTNTTGAERTTGTTAGAQGAHASTIAQIAQDITNNYIDIALDKLKIARNFSVNYFGICIPKNSIYGRPTKNLYVYITDFEQFLPDNGRTRFNIYVLDQRKDGKFHKVTVSKHTSWYKIIFAFINYHQHFNVKVEYQYCLNHISKPDRKEPQTKTGYMYKNGVYSQNRVDPYCYECIDTDVTRKIDRYAYVDRMR